MHACITSAGNIILDQHMIFINIGPNLLRKISKFTIFFSRLDGRKRADRVIKCVEGRNIKYKNLIGTFSFDPFQWLSIQWLSVSSFFWSLPHKRSNFTIYYRSSHFLIGNSTKVTKLDNTSSGLLQVYLYTAISFTLHYFLQVWIAALPIHGTINVPERTCVCVSM